MRYIGLLHHISRNFSMCEVNINFIVCDWCHPHAAAVTEMVEEHPSSYSSETQSGEGQVPVRTPRGDTDHW
jgi:hypothetical protein